MNLQKMMQQAQAMQKKIAELQERMDAAEIDGEAGGGMVRVRLNGKHHLLKVTIDPSLLKAEEKDMLEDLILAAYGDARKKIDEQFSGEMGALAGGIDLPPGMKLPF